MPLSSPPLRIHVVSLQVPFPPDYGGVIDIYYKLRALKSAGYEVLLHTYQYDRQQAPQLDQVADRVYYYPRNRSFARQFSVDPYIVSSRQSSQLLTDLLADDAPILFEGIHCCAHLADPRLTSRCKLVRMHNVEHEYYDGLARKATSWHRLYYRIEATRLKRYEAILAHADAILAITESDRCYFASKYPQVATLWLPAFQAHDRVAPLSPKGDYMLYHGNLSVEENIEAAQYLLQQVVPSTPGTSWVFAGKNPADRLARQIAATPGARLVANPSDEEMERLIGEAAANVLITFQPTGLKLKLLHALYTGGHCIVNSKMLVGTGLDRACLVADTPQALSHAVATVLKSPFDHQARERRIRLLEPYDSARNIARLTRLLTEKTL